MNRPATKAPRKVQWSQCAKKCRYATEHEAIHQVKIAEVRQPYKKFHAYWCEFCDGWHISGK